ncbi:MAG: LysM peptidoglycan-binding domain-containing protein [Candidatus Nanopelagicales bacterium]
MATMTMDYRSSFPRPSAAGQPPLRLTVRGRRMVAALVLLLATALALPAVSAWRAASAPTELATSLVSAHSVVVKPGDTLWTIAARELPALDPVEAVQRLREANGMTGASVLVAGATLHIPSR